MPNTKRFSTAELMELFAPLAYVFRDGPHVVYVGASAYGIGRPLSPGHKMHDRIMGGEKLSLELHICESAAEAFNLELDLIRKYQPKYNGNGKKRPYYYKTPSDAVCVKDNPAIAAYCQCQACTDLRQNSQPVSD